MSQVTMLNEKIKKEYPKLSKMERELVVKKLIALQDKGQNGQGFYDKIVNKVVSLYNKVKGKKPKNQHVLKDGEKHAVFKTKDGGLVGAKFAGPNTKTYENLKELIKENGGDLGKALRSQNFASDIDRISLIHDIKYDLFAGDHKRIREADEKYIAKAKEARRKEGNFNTLPAIVGIKAKMIGEDLGLLDKDKFSGKPKKLPEEERVLYEEVVRRLEQEGYGKNRPARNVYYQMRDRETGAKNRDNMEKIAEDIEREKTREEYEKKWREQAPPERPPDIRAQRREKRRRLRGNGECFEPVGDKQKRCTICDMTISRKNNGHIYSNRHKSNLMNRQL